MNDPHELAKPGRVYEPKPWRIGKVGAVVSDELAPDSCGGAEDIAYYGGNLVCESVAPINRPLIRSAPQMLALLRDILGKSYLSADNIGEGEKLIAHIDSDIRAMTRPEDK